MWFSFVIVGWQRKCTIHSYNQCVINGIRKFVKQNYCDVLSLTNFRHYGLRLKQCSEISIRWFENLAAQT